MTVAISEIAQQRTVRLIPTAYYKPPVLRALVDNDAELDVLAELEGRTSRRLSSASLAAAATYDAWGRTHISAAFTYVRKGGNRFNDESGGAWYAGFEDMTALTEVAFHKTRELAYVGHFHDTSRYRALHASFIGRFHDLRGDMPRPACLHPDIAIGYPAGQQLAALLRAQDSRGVIYPSVRHEGGICIAAFHPNVVQDVVPGACWQLTWSGTADWQATTP